MDDEGLPNPDESVWINSLDELEFHEEIGKGSFGSVWRGTYTGAEVAIKVLRKSLMEEHGLQNYVRREVSVSKLHHPNMVTLIGLFDNDEKDEFLIVAEYVAGGDLRKNLKKTTNLSWKTRVAWAFDIAKCMTFLHSKNILHRDLKSKNILVGADNKARVCDFGLARKYAGGSRPMTLCGTEEWMAPEVILGMPYNHKADVFSYGIVLIELLTRIKVKIDLQRVPQTGFTVDWNELLPKIPKDAPPAFVQLAKDCTESEADLRPEFAKVLVTLAEISKEVLKSSNSSMIKDMPAIKVDAAPSPHLTPDANKSSPSLKPADNREKSRSFLGAARIAERKKSLDLSKLKTVKVLNQEELAEALNTTFSPVTFSGWVVVGYKSLDTLAFQAKGTGGVEELVEQFHDNEVQYAVVRIAIEKDNTQIVTRDIFINWIGNQVPITQKGRKATHVGQVAELLKPFHAELTAVSKKNFTHEVVADRSKPLSGSHVID